MPCGQLSSVPSESTSDGETIGNWPFEESPKELILLPDSSVI